MPEDPSPPPDGEPPKRSAIVPRPLDAIGAELRVEVERAERAWRDAVGHAIRAGELLIEAKAQVRHGEWLPWLEANFPFSERTARNYMRLARESERVADLPTIRAAVALLAGRTDDEPSDGDPDDPFAEHKRWKARGEPRKPSDEADLLAMFDYHVDCVAHAREGRRTLYRGLLRVAAEPGGSPRLDAALAKAGQLGLIWADAEDRVEREELPEAEYEEAVQAAVQAEDDYRDAVVDLNALR
jgi:hypothetical protein